MSTYKQFDVVRLNRWLQDDGIEPGAKVVILDVIEHPELHYEVEIVDDRGETLFQGGLDPDDVGDWIY